ncbi:type I-F CRISPR-associated endoribonuclease Cas6/Csy4 [Candidatus Enterovibrio escicola]|uniref:type I-F CRISPR-associated endoribonuclease Cas6/Csy4 n=1 Tax=Candidatus Enterovibrio escicola TaxID=1927127 RepID=UPI001237CF28|nr:type I-F CRISPR-associated endoribonuclease Cas6/Csy4 [Candidatus Enterovibrio escacola]
MDNYIDIVVLPDAEISSPALINNLFAKLHRALVEHAGGDVAVSFPKYGTMLGEVLRLHGTRHTLDRLMTQPWLKGLRDYTSVNNISPMPDNIQGYHTTFRVQQKSPPNIRRRAIFKGWLIEDEALHKIPDFKQKRLSLPFIQIKSQSTNQEIWLFFQGGEQQDKLTTGHFFSYGLSREATVPWF